MKIPALQIYSFNWPGTPHNTGPRLVEIAVPRTRRDLPVSG